MSLINSIIDLSFSYVKQYYDKYRKKKKVKKLNCNQIKKFSTKLYDTRKYRMINYIQTNFQPCNGRTEAHRGSSRSRVRRAGWAPQGPKSRVVLFQIDFDAQKICFFTSTIFNFNQDNFYE